MGAVKDHNASTIPTIDIPKNGYIYVYCSNESNYDVFFDNLQLIHTRSPILEETHYYPFGLTMAGISSRAANVLENTKNKFQGQEFNDDFEINCYGFKYRNHDPQIGRFMSVDPLASSFPDMSPYAAFNNNPVRYTDPTGAAPEDWIGKKGTDGNTTWSWDENIKSADQAKTAGYDDYRAPGSIIDNGKIGGVSGTDGRTSVYLGKDANDVSFTYPNSTVTPFQVGTEWLSGDGPRNRSFTNGDVFTEMLRAHEHVQSTREMIPAAIWFSNQLNKLFHNDMPVAGSNPYSLGGLDGVGKYIKDYSTLLTGGKTGNLAVTYLGSYNLQWQVIDINESSATVIFTVNNTSTMQSASRPPVIGYWPSWQKTIGKRINESFKTGWGSKTTQTFKWTETIPLR